MISTKEIARSILEGGDGYCFKSRSWQNGYEGVLNFLKNVQVGGLLVVSGEPGSGVSTLINSVQKHYEKSSVLLKNLMFEGRCSIPDRVSYALALGSRKTWDKSAPLYLEEYIYLSGRRHIFIDDLDVIIDEKDDLELIINEINHLRTSKAGVNFVVSTRSLRLMKAFAKSSNKTEFLMMARTLSASCCMELVKDFWAWANARFGLDIDYAPSLLAMCQDTGFDIDNVVSLLRESYAIAVMSSQGKIPIDGYSSWGEAVFEVRKRVYS